MYIVVCNIIKLDIEEEVMEKFMSKGPGHFDTEDIEKLVSKGPGHFDTEDIEKLVNS